MRVVTADEARAIDQAAAAELSIPSVVLMENAALAAADLVRCRFGTLRSVAICCGPGNNGGDGLALARHLHARGHRVTAFLLCGEEKLRGDAGLQLRIARATRVDVREAEKMELTTLLATITEHELVVDALLGTGLSRPLEGRFEAIVVALNELPRPILALDLPSGLDASSSEVAGEHIEAAVTLSFLAPKVAHVLPPASAASGELWLASLSVPPSAILDEDAVLHLMRPGELSIPQRAAASHKGTFGHALVVAGSKGKSGAAVLAAKAAFRCGSGLVTVAVPEEITAEVEAACIEAMSWPLRPSGKGAAEAVARAAEGKHVMALGPGLGDDEETLEWIRAVALDTRLPLVLDADGVNAFAGRPETLRERSAATVLTPHPGEIGRLLETAVPRSSQDRQAAVREAARRSGAVVILKGHRSLITDPEGRIFINSSGNAGMATAGSGDVLTGAVASFMGQGCSAMDGARLATFLHGLAGDLAARSWGEQSLMAGDLLTFLPLAIRALQRTSPARPEGPCVAIDKTEVRRMIEESAANRD